MFELFDAIFLAVELVAWWRFFLCLLVSIAVGVFIAERVANRSLATAIGVPIVAAGTIGGAIWEYRRGEKNKP